MDSLMNLPPLILASSSPRRVELLRGMGLDFRVVPSEATEIQHEHLTVHEICQLNAYRKARVVAKKIPDALVLGADTLVYLDDDILGKPGSLAEARRMISRLQGRTHRVATGVCLTHLRTLRQKVFVETTVVTFKRLNFQQAAAYVRSINPLDKAGGYAIQENGDAIVEKISGSYSNVVGLPVERLREELAAWR
jgi:septum formation protein